MLKAAADLPFTLASPKEKEGWLNKRGDVVKNWKKRWVILYEDTLYYFRSKPGPMDVKVDLAGKIPLLGSALGEEKQIDNKEFCFSVTAERRKYFIQASSEKEKLEWMDCIAKKVASLNIASMSDANIEDLVEKTGFTKEKLQKYIALFSKKYTSGTVSRDDFIKDVQKAVYRGSEAFWREMYITLFGNTTSPPGSSRMSPRHAYSDKISLREYLIGLSRVKHATSTQKLIWAFKLLDENNDGKLSVDELNQLVYSPPRASEFEGLSDTDEQKYSVAGILKRINLKDADNIEFSHFAVAFQDDKIVQNTVKFCLKSALQAASECKYKMFDHQVAGHKGKMSMLADETGNTILKPLNSHEYGFYVYLKDELEKNPKIPADYFPKFYGSIFIEQPNSPSQTSHVNSTPSHYIILENLLKGYKSPSVMDIKMGGNSSGTDPNASVIKRFKQSVVSNMTTSHVLGFRVAGMKVWQTDGQVLNKGGLESSKNITTLNETMKQYFFNGKIYRVDVLPKLVKRLEELIAWFTEQETFLFLSSSVLLMYDGDGESADVKMIDFAHSFPSSKRDETYLFGLQNLLDTLKALHVDMKDEVSSLGEALHNNPNLHHAIGFSSLGDSAMKDASKAL
jgi:1D-myo-inositol-tetrakisphosphate 5-kinase/inositol-polyphosphate multikinase